LNYSKILKIDQRKAPGMLLKKNFLLICLACILLLCGQALAEDYAADIKSKVLLRTETMSNGQPIDYLDFEKPNLTVLDLEIAPGSQTGWHSHPVNVYAYVMSGRISVEIEGGKTAEFKEGEVIVEVVNLLHNGVNREKVPVRLIVFYLGAKNLPNVLKAEKK